MKKVLISGEFRSPAILTKAGRESYRFHLGTAEYHVEIEPGPGGQEWVYSKSLQRVIVGGLSTISERERNEVLEAITRHMASARRNPVIKQ